MKISSFQMNGKMKTGQWNKVIDHNIPGDIRAIKVLKLNDGCLLSLRDISLKYAEQNVESIKDKLPLWQFDLVAGIIGSLREKMTKTGLHHDNILKQRQTIIG